jgi:hypothetical protein
VLPIGGGAGVLKLVEGALVGSGGGGADCTGGGGTACEGGGGPPGRWVGMGPVGRGGGLIPPLNALGL